MKKKIKVYDGVVKSMRLIRDELNNEIMNMSFEEEKIFLKNKLKLLKGNNNISSV